MALYVLVGSVLTPSSPASPNSATGSSPKRSGQTALSLPADSIADMVGVDSHFNYRGTPYTTVPAVKALLLASGIRHVRDSGAPWAHNNIATTVTQTDAEIATLHRQNPNADFVELCGNEFDSHRDQDWAATLRACVTHQSALVRGWGLPVLAPSLSNFKNAAKLGDLSGHVDAANAHFGQCGDNPISTRYASFAQVSQENRAIAPALWVTEYGYNTYVPGGASYQTRPCAIPARYVAAYQVRSLFEWALLGVQHVYLYQFADMPSDVTFGGEGMVNADGSPKPEYSAVKNLVALFADPGSPFTPAAVSVTVSANPIVHHLIAKKRDGTVLVALWREGRDFDWQKQQPLSLPLENATVSVSGYVPVAMYAWQADGSLPSSSKVPAVISLGVDAVVVTYRAKGG